STVIVVRIEDVRAILVELSRALLGQGIEAQPPAPGRLRPARQQATYEQQAQGLRQQMIVVGRPAGVVEVLEDMNAGLLGALQNAGAQTQVDAAQTRQSSEREDPGQEPQRDLLRRGPMHAASEG